MWKSIAEKTKRKIYDTWDISPVTGLQKQPDGSWKTPEKGKQEKEAVEDLATVKESNVNGKKSKFFQLNDDVMDINGQMIEGEIPKIGQIYYQEEYAEDPTELDTVSKEVRGKGFATKGVIKAMKFFKNNGFDSFAVDTMNEHSAKLMKRLEEKGYVKPLDHDYRFDGDTVTYKILKVV